MELMASCFDKLLKLIRKPIPESILGKLTFFVNIKMILFYIQSSFCFCVYLDSYCIELSERKTWYHASRFVLFYQEK